MLGVYPLHAEHASLQHFTLIQNNEQYLMRTQRNNMRWVRLVILSIYLPFNPAADSG